MDIFVSVPKPIVGDNNPTWKRINGLQIFQPGILNYHSGHFVFVPKPIVGDNNPTWKRINGLQIFQPGIINYHSGHSLCLYQNP